MYYAVRETGLIEQCHRQNVQIVEPASDLTCVLNDEVRGEVAVEPLLVLKGIVLLCERYRTALEPAVENFGYSYHSAVTVGAVALELDLIHILSVQIGEPYAALLLYLIDRTQYDSLAALVALPYRDRSRPVSVSGYIPVTGILQPLAESAVFNCLGYPVYQLVLSYQLVLDL